ncbi:WecB/TagA/CpsF family glycosyltransferase [Pseudorhizobium marinum]|uniref:WecB/TagA/CpsF family glycosyltransferase n=1 Tax=Pseudorhizobium marinum TaxID=1496690 RepID=UPI0004976F14|nr:WecB/TagA/CpsF family glycosyltransferase [Pseudorhizobium marinum]
MIDKGKVNIIGVDVNVVDYDGAVAKIVHAAKTKTQFGVSALAVHGVMTGAMDPEHRHRLNSLELVTPDGQPVRWAMKFLYGVSLPDRVYGPNLTLDVCKAAADEGLSIYLYGSREEVLERWISNLGKLYPALRIAGHEPSKFRKLSASENDEMINRIQASGADIVFVGLGCPRQEVFVYENKGRLSLPMLAVGAAFDFHAGLLPQAPKWMQDRGLEWLFRLRQEPKRLWRRYLHLNPLYVRKVLQQKIGAHKMVPDHPHQPSEMRYG